MKTDYVKLFHLYSSVLDDFVLVEITMGSDEAAQTIFQRINGGLSLNQFDLLRADLFHRAQNRKTREDLYIKYWHHFDEEDQFWRQPGREDHFLRKFLELKLPGKSDNFRSLDFANTVHGGGLCDIYQMAYRRTLDKELKSYGVEYEFKELSRYANIFQELKNPNSRHIGCRIEFFRRFRKNFDIVSHLELFIMYLTAELRLSDSELNQIFDFLESYAIRWLLFTGGTVPTKGLMDFFLDICNRNRCFSLLSLVHILAESKPNFNATELKQRLLHGKKFVHKQRSKFIRHITSRIGGGLSSLHESEVLERFCDIWPSPEAMLPFCFNEGLPIVYTKVLPAQEATSRFESYTFVTYDGKRQLAKYEVHRDGTKVTGYDDCRNVRVELNRQEILFAFPAFSQPDVNLRDDVKNQNLTPVSKDEKIEVHHWLWLESGATADPHSNYRFLPDIEATAITRAGHVLAGVMKSISDDAIYMQIREQTVVVFLHALYELNTASMLQSEPFTFVTDGGIIELSKHETRGNRVIGTNPENSGNW